MEKLHCQSCGMPLAANSDYGTNADGSKNEDYCTYCFKEGAFTDETATMESMIETCVPFMKESGMPEDQARAILQMQLPHLKRWRK